MFGPPPPLAPPSLPSLSLMLFPSHTFCLSRTALIRTRTLPSRMQASTHLQRLVVGPQLCGVVAVRREAFEPCYLVELLVGARENLVRAEAERERLDVLVAKARPEAADGILASTSRGGWVGGRGAWEGGEGGRRAESVDKRQGGE
eukprot:353939-Chlamydomonas_euryale.AAC.24